MSLSINVQPGSEGNVTASCEVFVKNGKSDCPTFGMLTITTDGSDAVKLFVYPEQVAWLDRIIAAAGKLRDALRMHDPKYVPTIEEALADPAGFVEGMTETRAEHTPSEAEIQSALDFGKTAEQHLRQ